MVTCSMVDTVPISKMNTAHARKPLSSNSSGFRLLDADHLEAASSVSKNSVYKLKIDLMFDDTRSIRSNRLDDTRGSHRTRSIIMYGRSELASTGQSARSITSLLQESTETTKKLATSTKKDVQRMSNSVQEQIEQLFTDVAKDATSSFAVIYLGSLPLKDKVTSLQGLQAPLRELYLKELNTKKKCSGFLEICTTGLRVKMNTNYNTNTQSEENITPFHNIAVWSAVKFVVSDSDGGAAFLPLITDPDNIDKTSLFRPLCGNEKNQVPSNGHAPIFAVVMRSPGLPKVLKCHAFICKSTEDAIVIAATLYQSLMSHVNSSSHRSTKRRTPRNQNGVSCISIASSSARTGSNYLSQSHALSNGRKSSLRSSSESLGAEIATPTRSGRRKRIPNNTLTSSNNVINETETTTEERRRKSHKSKRAPPIPNGMHSGNSVRNINNQAAIALKDTFCDDCGGGGFLSVADSLGANSNSGLRNETNGDILTRVAIPRSGSFLNTGGLTRYKSRAARRHSGKLGGGGGSPLGFSELFNEFRLHENLHSLDEILYAIIDADGMSFNDLKPIYKEFLLKLAVTLTKDELFQRSKNIMRRQRKKKLKRRSNAPVTQKKSKTLLFGTKSLKKVLHLGQFRSCRGKPHMSKQPRNKKEEVHNLNINRTHEVQPTVIGRSNDQQRARVATSGSDVSVVRKDNTLRGPNRNSSSGYVSCSECSYDSESCTCTSADRCYCSLRTDHVDSRLRRKSERNNITSKNSSSVSRRNTNNSPGGNINRHSLISCKSDEKCYCSMVEEDSALPGGDFANTHSDTTWCDTDSCVSTSKCYCQRSQADHQQRSVRDHTSTPFSHKGSTKGQTAAEKLALDYELFTISGNGKSVQPHEALSVKKSVEAAAIFGDMKLSQTTDIKSICPPPSVKSKTSLSVRNARSEEAKKYAQSVKKRESSSIDRRHKHHSTGALSSSSSQKSHSAEDLLGKLRAMEKNSKSASVKSARSKGHTLLGEFEKRGSFHSNYQSMRAVNASLEDTLGSCRGKPHMSKQPRNKKEEVHNLNINRTHEVQPTVIGRSNDQQRARVATSGSDVSVVRKDNTLRGPNRNSSSGYVSCSECSYDSESCTCTSADRCYCSLRTDHVDSRLRRKSERNNITSKNSSSVSRRNTNNSPGGNINRHSLISCKSDEKCYCSMVEEDSALPGGDFANTHSDTTWCDTDSCVSTSKCYCQRSQADHQQRSVRDHTSTPFSHKGSTKGQTAAEKLALDYELFTISGNGKSVQPHEALSVKKSVEAAAIFGDMKLSQTTDIKSICPPPSVKSKTSLSVRNARSEEAKKYAQSVKKRESSSIDRRHKHHSTGALSSSSSQKSHSAEDLLGKLRAMEKNSKSASVKSARSKGHTLLGEFEKRGSFHSNYQSMRAVNASLEDTLGYLP